MLFSSAGYTGHSAITPPLVGVPSPPILGKMHRVKGLSPFTYEKSVNPFSSFSSSPSLRGIRGSSGRVLAGFGSSLRHLHTPPGGFEEELPRSLGRSASDKGGGRGLSTVNTRKKRIWRRLRQKEKLFIPSSSTSLPSFSAVMGKGKENKESDKEEASHLPSSSFSFFSKKKKQRRISNKEINSSSLPLPSFISPSAHSLLSHHPPEDLHQKRIEEELKKGESWRQKQQKQVEEGRRKSETRMEDSPPTQWSKGMTTGSSNSRPQSDASMTAFRRMERDLQEALAMERKNTPLYTISPTTTVFGSDLDRLEEDYRRECGQTLTHTVSQLQKRFSPSPSFSSSLGGVPEMKGSSGIEKTKEGCRGVPGGINGDPFSVYGGGALGNRLRWEPSSSFDKIRQEEKVRGEEGRESRRVGDGDEEEEKEEHPYSYGTLSEQRRRAKRDPNLVVGRSSSNQFLSAHMMMANAIRNSDNLHSHPVHASTPLNHPTMSNNNHHHNDNTVRGNHANNTPEEGDVEQRKRWPKRTEVSMRTKMKEVEEGKCHNMKEYFPGHCISRGPEIKTRKKEDTTSSEVTHTPLSAVKAREGRGSGKIVRLLQSEVENERKSGEGISVNETATLDKLCQDEQGSRESEDQPEEVNPHFAVGSSSPPHGGVADEHPSSDPLHGRAVRYQEGGKGKDEWHRALAEQDITSSWVPSCIQVDGRRAPPFNEGFSEKHLYSFFSPSSVSSPVGSRNGCANQMKKSGEEMKEHKVRYNAYSPRPWEECIPTFREANYWDHHPEDRQQLEAQLRAESALFQQERWQEGAADTTEVNYSLHKLRREMLLFHQAHPVNETIVEPIVRIREIHPIAYHLPSNIGSSFPSTSTATATTSSGIRTGEVLRYHPEALLYPGDWLRHHQIPAEISERIEEDLDSTSSTISTFPPPTTTSTSFSQSSSGETSNALMVIPPSSSVVDSMATAKQRYNHALQIAVDYLFRDQDVPLSEACRIAADLGVDLIKIGSFFTSRTDRRVIALCALGSHREHLRGMIRFKLQKLGVQPPPTKACIEVPFKGGTHPHAMRVKAVGIARRLLHRHVVRLQLTKFGTPREGFAVFQTMLDEVLQQCTSLHAYHTAGRIQSNYNEVYCYLYPSTGKSPKASVSHPSPDQVRQARDLRLLADEKEINFDDYYDLPSLKARMQYEKKLADGTAWAAKDDGLSLQRQRAIKVMLGYLPKGNKEMYAARGDVNVPAPFRTSHPTGTDRWNFALPGDNLEQASRGAAVLGKRAAMPVSTMHDQQETEDQPSTLDRFYYRAQGSALEVGELKEALGLKDNRRRGIPLAPGFASLHTSEKGKAGSGNQSGEDPHFAAH